MRVGIVGAGAAGLCAIKHAVVSFGCDVIAFEQSDNIGGTWVYTEKTGKDKYGNDIHSSMYKGLHTNLPKELMSFPEFPFSTQDKSFVAANDVNQYLNHYADSFNLRQFIKFETHVVRVRPLLDDTWEVIVKNVKDERLQNYIFDAVFVCNGHFSTPFLPRFHGQSIFKGGQMHSHDYRQPQIFNDKSVLVIGGGPSGVDISQEMSGCAKKVFWSNHINPPKVLTISNLIQKPDIESFNPNGATFTDGSTETFDEIVYCTGYDFTFPFLSVDCEIMCDDNYIRPLYKHCVNINKPTLGIIGLPVYVCPFQMFDLQIRFCLTFMTNKKKWPSKEDMMADTDRDMQDRWSRGVTKRKAHSMGTGHQDNYFAALSKEAEIEAVKPVVLKMYNENRQNQKNHPEKYRKFKFTILDDENYVSELLED